MQQLVNSLVECLPPGRIIRPREARHLIYYLRLEQLLHPAKNNNSVVGITRWRY